PYGFARRHGVLALEGAEVVEVIHRPDTSLHSLIELRRALDRPLRLRVVDPAEFEARLQRHYQADDDGTARMMAEIDAELDLGEAARALSEPADLLESADDAPVIRLINALLTQAVRENASDIHLEAFEHELRVRFRVDGVLREVLAPPRAIGPLLISRIKVMANLDIAEKRLPQDGRISLRIAGRPVDVRVATLPSGHGERAVLRLLDKSAGRLDLGQLGMNGSDRQRLERLLGRPHGILLVTGPTGSGKTTTLYAALSHLNDRVRNIMTVEDPIEYYLDGISQTQVNTKVELSFARGLRAILRQDPDVVMVGEIRDLETAEIAVQASLTGHLVLSTLHTNSAVGAITRLRDMGVEPFLLASSLIGVVAQRLVRRLCPHCKRLHPAGEGERRLLVLEQPLTLHTPVGCEHCAHSGYRGRIGTFELVAIDAELAGMIHDNAGEHALERHARRHGPSIRADCRDRVLRGETSMEEFVRVLQDE
ncbi:MAG: type II secretion system ATPase GspE, partial [Candidatus Competibacterales bacterium]|nr:type II secretion system ATPase GspE [Candidatus Competibacterales bacterium]